jgi:phosphoribulokinase
LVVANELDSNENVSYHVDIELGCYPATKTEYITKICVKNSSITFSSGNYDMSSNASENDTDIVALSFDFSTRNANEDFFIQGESGNSIKAKVNRITITELL